jgi:hypothetical protein
MTISVLEKLVHVRLHPPAAQLDDPDNAAARQIARPAVGQAEVNHPPRDIVGRPDSTLSAWRPKLEVWLEHQDSLLLEKLIFNQRTQTAARSLVRRLGTRNIDPYLRSLGYNELSIRIVAKSSAHLLMGVV